MPASTSAWCASSGNPCSLNVSKGVNFLILYLGFLYNEGNHISCNEYSVCCNIQDLCAVSRKSNKYVSCASECGKNDIILVNSRANCSANSRPCDGRPNSIPSHISRTS